jgi:hypothetical protein
VKTKAYCYVSKDMLLNLVKAAQRHNFEMKFSTRSVVLLESKLVSSLSYKDRLILYNNTNLGELVKLNRC